MSLNKERLRREIQRRDAAGIERVSMAELRRRYQELGYDFDRSFDCRATATIMTGPGAGDTYPCCTTGVIECDTRRSAFHVESRRDRNFERMQELRFSGPYAISRGYIFEP